jgi:hypothetical protein
MKSLFSYTRYIPSSTTRAISRHDVTTPLSISPHISHFMDINLFGVLCAGRYNLYKHVMKHDGMDEWIYMVNFS